MNRHITILAQSLIGAWIGLATWSAALAVVVIDDRGQAIEFANPPQRIISLAPNITELLFAVGAGSQVKAVSEYSDYPADASALPKIANALGVNLERILDLQPDLVIAWLSGNGQRVIDRLEHLGIRVFVTEPRRFADVERLLSVFGQITGHPREGSSQARRFRKQVASLRDQYAWKSSMSVFYQLSQRPLMTINRDHIISELLTLCGGDNVFADYRLLAPTVNIEDVMKRDADVILISSTVPNVSRIRSQWLMMQDLKAAKTERVFIVDADLINRQTPRLVQGLEQVCQLIDQARSG